ncbi:hypothetical protein B0H67DRAFT_497694, partial [Lasiosphaeris hirsuta]
LNLEEFADVLFTNRCKKGELSPEARAAICVMVAVGQSERFVSQLFHVCPLEDCQYH